MSKLGRKTIVKIGIVIVVGACAVVWGARSTLSRVFASTPDPSHAIHVPHAAAPIHVDAEMEGKKVWESEAGSTANLKDDHGAGMVPYTEVKARWGDGRLYLWMYAGDLDLEGTVREPDGDLSKDDSFHVEVGGSGRVYVIDVSVLGTIADAVCTGPSGSASRRCDASWQSHAVVAVDADGTLNKLGDNDEEWLVEMAIPLESLGLSQARPGTRVPFAVRRCDMGRDGPRACGTWGMGARRGELILDP
jgi:hypothetical protein